MKKIENLVYKDDFEMLGDFRKIDYEFFKKSREIAIGDIIPSGSFHINGVGNDVDYFFHNRTPRRFLEYLKGQGFINEDGGQYARSNFISFRKEDLNIVYVKFMHDFINIRKSTEICKLLNVREKSQRIAVFDIVRGNDKGLK